MIYSQYDLRSIHSFNSWKSSIIFNLQNNQLCHPDCQITWNHLFSLIKNGDGTIYHAQGDGKITVFRWPNGEYKHISIIDDVIVGEEDFWLARYPFLEIDSETNSYILAKKLAFPHKDIYCKHERLSIVSHNSHFGHFIADDLPRLYAGILTLKSQSLATPSSSVPLFALNELKKNKLDIRILPESMKKGSCISYHGQVMHTYIMDWMVKSYILRKAIFFQYDSYDTSTKRNLLSSQNKRLIFIKRSRQFGSRIANLREIQEYLEVRGFTTVCLDKLSLMECVDLLSNCELAVAESGSTTLSTAISLRRDARLVSLQPKVLLKNPSSEMLMGGIPYSLLFHPNIRIVIGEEVQKSLVQSSSICRFNVNELEKYITNF